MPREAQVVGGALVGGEPNRWFFFDDLKKSETYAEQVEYCPACGRPLERKDLRMIGHLDGSR